MTIGDGIAIAAIAGLSAAGLHYGHDFIASAVFVVGIAAILFPAHFAHLLSWLMPE